MVDDRESMIGVESWGSIPQYDHIARMNGGGLPFVDVPGDRLPDDATRDRMIMNRLSEEDVPLRKGAKLNYAQSKALYEIVRDYFDDVDPLMNTERWMASFVEDRGMSYTDHDGSHYVMKGGVRKLVDAPQHAQLDDLDDEDDDTDFDTTPGVTVL